MLRFGLDRVCVVDEGDDGAFGATPITGEHVELEDSHHELLRLNVRLCRLSDLASLGSGHNRPFLGASETVACVREAEDRDRRMGLRVGPMGELGRRVLANLRLVRECRGR